MAEETKEVDRTPRNLSLSNYAPHARKLVDDIKVGKRVINGHKIPEPDWANDECAFYCEELGLCRTTRTDVTVAGLFFQYATNCLKRCENEFSLELFAGSDWIAGGSELDAIKARLFALESVVEEIKDGNSYLIRDAKAREERRLARQAMLANQDGEESNSQTRESSDSEHVQQEVLLTPSNNNPKRKGLSGTGSANKRPNLRNSPRAGQDT